MNRPNDYEAFVQGKADHSSHKLNNTHLSTPSYRAQGTVNADTLSSQCLTTCQKIKQDQHIDSDLDTLLIRSDWRFATFWRIIGDV